MSSTEVTKILDDPALSSDARAELILPHVYAQLRGAAQRAMAAEDAGHTLQATALVHEAFIKLTGNRQIPWGSRAHFYVAAAEAIRQILLDHAKSKGRIKRGGGVNRVSLDFSNIAELSETNSDTMLSVDDAFRRLESVDDRAAVIARLRVFAGLTNGDVGRMLDLSTRTVERDWAFARRFMARALLEIEPEDGLGQDQNCSR